jgi:hypothetical protein
MGVQRASQTVSRRVTRRHGRLAVVVVCLFLASPWPVGEAQSGLPAPTLDSAQRLLEQSQALRKAGKYDEALPPAEQALAIREREPRESGAWTPMPGTATHQHARCEAD